ncbi:sugar transferase [Paragemmobacter straminiformis]|uniref:Sugar transferase n=1 Tax=Paragemmobacter straminiformis TaxID=2045119 RepID=A0A842I515_9RHOB|nr:sugar transferase [Gemmobacter straminiformis]MBC2835222.1 sugar transferase [Gemmobacter straminiformis]
MVYFPGDRFQSKGVSPGRSASAKRSPPVGRPDTGLSFKYRAFDLAIAIVALPAIALLVIILFLVVKLDNPRAPAFFLQTRYGKDGKPFRIVKMRTMVPDAESLKADLCGQPLAQAAGFKMKDDPRITRPGRWMRKTYLDELPQIWNVICGHMSFVGPRANSCPPQHLEPWQRARLAVRPGITGTWQVMRDKPTDFVERCKIDLDYIASKSLRGDIRVLFDTALVALVRRTGV